MVSAPSMQSDKSLVYTMNNSGPNTDPSGTPHVISRLSDVLLLYMTYCFRFAK